MSTSQWSSINSLTTKSSYIPNSEEAMLSANDYNANHYYGYDVAISGDKTRVIVGAPYTTAGQNTSGKVYIYIKSGSTWTLEAGFVPGVASSGDRVGIAVSIDYSGTRIAASAYFYPGGGSTGRVYIYTRSGTTWSIETTLTGPTSGEYFGYDIFFDNNADRIIIGSYAKDTNGQDSGSVSIYRRSNTSWIQELVYTPPDTVTFDYFGCSTYLSGDGTRAAIGSQYSDPGGVSSAGSVHILSRSGTTWSLETKLTANDKATGDQFGYSCALDYSGTRCVVGAFSTDGTGLNNTGKVYIYSRSGTTWSLESGLLPSDIKAGMVFGCSVDINDTGDIVIIGAYNAGTIGGGQAYIFSRTGTTWVQERILNGSTTESGDRFGYSVSISSNGDKIIIGAQLANMPGGIDNAGKVYIFT